MPFNRTILELKLSRLLSQEVSIDSFKRTILELKLLNYPIGLMAFLLLIVPFWN